MINIGMFTPVFQGVVDNILLEQNYHFADINLFWEDIRINSKQRIDAYFASNKE